MASYSAPQSPLPISNCRRIGTVATEFSLCIPLLLSLAFACADFGRISFYHQVVCNAARTGAEYGATHGFTPHTKPLWEQGIREAAMSEMQNIPGFDVNECEFSMTATIDSDDLARIEVNVSYPFRTVVAWPALPNEVFLHKKVEFRQFR